ncbi:GNAT family N-acetyltransferase [Bacteriovoracaceae bacterium]|nr:GNAT family N-acetyltransferase [Bacteriovoracaceae bacterium]
MSDVKIVPVRTSKQLKDFIHTPWNLYQGDEKWVPPLRMAVADLLKPKHPFYETSDMQNFVAYQGKKPIGRISAVWNKNHNDFHEEKRGFIGFTEFPNDQGIAQKLFDTAEKWLKEKGANCILGPMNPSTNYECGTLVEGFEDPAQIMMTYNQPYHDDLYKKNGYTKAKDLIAYRLKTEFDMPEIIKRIADRTEKKEKITYRHAKKKNWDAEVDLMHEIYNDAWEKNWGFIPMTPAEFLHTAKDLKTIIDEKLIIIVEVDNKPAGFIVTLPDLHQVLKKIPNGKLLPTGLFKLLNQKKYVNRCRVITLGMKKEFRKKGLETLLYTKAHQVIKEQGYGEIEMSWILEDNLNMNKPLIRMGGEPYKKYRIYQKEI